MLLRNINQSTGLCNGTRMTLTQLGTRYIEAQIITRKHVGEKVCIPQIIMTPNDTKWPFKLKRRQFSLFVCFAMTINKSLGQSLKKVGLYLPRQVFCHGQLYVVLSRVTNRNGLKVLTCRDESSEGTMVKKHCLETDFLTKGIYFNFNILNCYIFQIINDNMEGTFEVLHVIFCFVAGCGIVRGSSWRFVDFIMR
jgi:hypothetical protein